MFSPAGKILAALIVCLGFLRVARSLLVDVSAELGPNPLRFK